MERVDILQPRERVEDRRKLLIERLGCVFDLTGVEGANTTDLISGADLSWEPPLGSRQDDIEELLRRRDWCDIFPGLPLSVAGESVNPMRASEQRELTSCIFYWLPRKR